MIVTCQGCRNQIQIPEGMGSCQCPICRTVLRNDASAPATQNSPAYALFTQVDTDRSGKLNVNELQAALQSGGLRFTLPTVNILMRKYSPQTFEIDFPGFEALLQEIWQWKAAFDFYDTDKGGFLDQNEFANALVKIGYQFPPEVVNTIFISSDDDHSGTLELDNFIKIISQIQCLTSKFVNLDQNRSGSITVDFNTLITLCFGCF